MLIRRRYVRWVARRMIVGVRSGMVLMLGLRRERLGRGGRCPRPVVRPVAFIGAIHLQGRISSTQPEESHPPRSARDDDTKGPDTAGMIASARAPSDLSRYYTLRNLKRRTDRSTARENVSLCSRTDENTVRRSSRLTTESASQLTKHMHGGDEFT